jgi:DNA-binding beta-propeller fold protein YncE
MWVTNQVDNNVMKFKADDFSLIDTFPTGARPATATFDGEHIWITNYDAGTVTELRASDGATLGTYTAGPQPAGAVFDGANVWVSLGGANYVRKF